MSGNGDDSQQGVYGEQAVHLVRLQAEISVMTKRAEVAEKVAEAAVDVVISNMLDSVEPSQLKYSFKLAVDEYLAERMRLKAW